MKFVMTGHSGLIGSFLLDRLKREGHEPVLLLDKREGKDISELNKIDFDSKADVFFHLAALCKVNQTVKDPQLSFDNNVLGVFEALEFCRKNKIPKFVYTSSSRVLSEEKNPYTASKIYGEELCKAYSQCYGIDYIIIRPSTVYGPFNDSTSRLIDIFILNVLRGEELKIFGDENKTLDFTYIDDYIDGMMLAIKEKNKEFNISAEQVVKVSDIADMIINLNGSGSKMFYPAEIAQPQQVGIDISEIKKLGYEPKVSIEKGIKKTYGWYKENLDRILKERQ